MHWLVGLMNYAIDINDYETVFLLFLATIRYGSSRCNLFLCYMPYYWSCLLDYKNFIACATCFASQRLFKCIHLASLGRSWCVGRKPRNFYDSHDCNRRDLYFWPYTSPLATYCKRGSLHHQGQPLVMHRICIHHVYSVFVYRIRILLHRLLLFKGIWHNRQSVLLLFFSPLVIGLHAHRLWPDSLLLLGP